MSTKKKMRRTGALDIEIIDVREFDKLLSYIRLLYPREHEEVIDKISGSLGPKILCVSGCREVYIVSERLAETATILSDRGAEVLSAGLRVGEVVAGRLVPNPVFMEYVFRLTGRFRGAVVAREEGVRSFLYGRDLLYESLERVYPPVEKNMIVSVLDTSDLSVIGVGVFLEDIGDVLSWPRRGEFLKRPVVANIRDLGLYLRRQELFIE